MMDPLAWEPDPLPALPPKTLQFTLNVGVNPGYHHQNHVAGADALDVAVAVWQKLADDMFLERGVYVSAVAAPAKTLYRQEWGCPAGGEDTVVFTGLLNYHVAKVNATLWKQAVDELCDRVRKELKQTTAYLTWQEIPFAYLRDRPAG